jgi:hypothetical protein
MGIRICIHCKEQLSPYASKSTKYCGKPKCKAARRRISDKKRCPRKPKFCTVCGCDITALWPETICGRQSCIDVNKEKKKSIISKKSARYYKKHKRKLKRKRCEICRKRIPRSAHGSAKTCGRDECVKEKAAIIRARKKLRHVILVSQREAKERKIEQLRIKKKEVKQKKQKVVVFKRPLVFDKNDEDYFDNDMFIAKQKKLEKKNGRYCERCKKALTGNYYNHCPTCLPGIERLADGVADAWI